MIAYTQFLKALVKSFYCKHDEDAVVSPGLSKFIITEDTKKIETEDGYYLITEG